MTHTQTEYKVDKDGNYEAPSFSCYTVVEDTEVDSSLKIEYSKPSFNIRAINTATSKCVYEAKYVIRFLCKKVELNNKELYCLFFSHEKSRAIMHLSLFDLDGNVYLDNYTKPIYDVNDPSSQIYVANFRVINGRLAVALSDQYDLIVIMYKVNEDFSLEEDTYWRDNDRSPLVDSIRFASDDEIEVGGDYQRLKRGRHCFYYDETADDEYNSYRYFQTYTKIPNESRWAQGVIEDF